jgi:S-adenosyl-L-methionine hydrolase (adenosine-forming)
MQIVSLTTDYGSKDFHVAELRASILSKCKNATLVDISHHIDHFDILQAAFFIKNVIPSFPKGSIHIVAVNIHYKRKSEFVVLERDGQYFIGPNNGIFSLLFDDINPSHVFLINHGETLLLPLHQLYGHVAAYISHGLPINEIGPPVLSFTQKSTIQPVITADMIRATIIHIDHFENVIVNLKQEVFDRVRNGRSFALYYKQYDPIKFLSYDYGDVAIGDPLAFFNSSGYLEIAINMDKASSLLNLYKNEMIQINFY